MSTDPMSPDFSYNEYSLQQLDNWLHDAIGCETLTPQQIYDQIVKTVSDLVEYHASQLNRSADLLSLLKGNRLIEFDTSLDDVDATPDPMRKQLDPLRIAVTILNLCTKIHRQSFPTHH